MKPFHAALAASLAAFAAASLAADPDLGRDLAATCANCHGTDGRALTGSGLKALSGVDKQTLLHKLDDFKSGRQPASIMQQIAKGYTDEQLDLIAAYFAGQKELTR